MCIHRREEKLESGCEGKIPHSLPWLIVPLGGALVNMRTLYRGENELEVWGGDPINELSPLLPLVLFVLFYLFCPTAFLFLVSILIFHHFFVCHQLLRYETTSSLA